MVTEHSFHQTMSNHLHVQTQRIVSRTVQSSNSQRGHNEKWAQCWLFYQQDKPLFASHFKGSIYREGCVQAWLKSSSALSDILDDRHSEVVYDARGGELLLSCGRGRHFQSDWEPPSSASCLIISDWWSMRSSHSSVCTSCNSVLYLSYLYNYYDLF